MSQTRSRFVVYLALAIAVTQLVGCACGRMTATSIPADPTYRTATLPFAKPNEDGITPDISASVVAFDTELRKLLGVTNLEDAFVGCVNGVDLTGKDRVCSQQLNYDKEQDVVYTYVTEANPKSCRFMRAWDEAQKSKPSKDMPIVIAVEPTDPDCETGCTAAKYCVSTGRCTKNYPYCVKCP